MTNHGVAAVTLFLAESAFCDVSLNADSITWLQGKLQFQNVISLRIQELQDNYKNILQLLANNL
jgi:hypothetical protein